MIRRLSPILWTVIAVAALGSNSPLFADLLPVGHKNVSHKLVFVDSPPLESHRLIAMPVRGFGGVTEVQSGRPFAFSTKYGTRLYIVPRDYVPPQRFNPGEPLPFPSCDAPVTCVTSMPRFSPVASLLSTCKLTKVADGEIQVELIDHVRLDKHGRPASVLRGMLPLSLIATVGLVGCWVLRRRARTLRTGDSDR